MVESPVDIIPTEQVEAKLEHAGKVCDSFHVVTRKTFKVVRLPKQIQSFAAEGMAMVAKKQLITEEEFSEIDLPGRHDLVDGELWSMAPTRIPQGRFATRVVALFWSSLTCGYARWR